MRNRYVVKNGTIECGFSKRVIDDMDMLNLIKFSRLRREPNGTTYIYIPSFDNR